MVALVVMVVKVKMVEGVIVRSARSSCSNDDVQPEVRQNPLFEFSLSPCHGGAYPRPYTFIVNVFRLLPCLSPLYENHSAVNAVDSALDTLASAVGKHQVVFQNIKLWLHTK